MGDYYQPRHASAANLHCTTSKPHHPRPAGTPAGDALAFTHRVLSDVYEQLRAQGIDRTMLDSSFATAFASTGVSPAALRQPGRDDREQDAVRLAPAGPEPIPDLPGADLRPDPGEAGTVTEFLDCLRNYRIWAGSPSYRTMSRNCQRRFAPSTICTALGGDSLPSFEMVIAIVTACGGPAAHQSEFATAWRRLAIPRQEGDQAAS